MTRRPLILQLIHTLSEDTYGQFLHKGDQKFHDFNDIRKEIEYETDRVTGDRGISNERIILKIFSPNG